MARGETSRGGLLRRLVGEPLVLFLLLGLALFVGERWWSARHQRIVVSAAEVARIADLWSAQMGRPATAAELDGLVDQHVREEVLYRAALTLGLDRDDVIVRRRLAQKMAFLLEDEKPVEEPSEEALRAHFRAHPERWERPERASFQHVYWSAESRGGSVEAAAEAARAALASLRAAPRDALAQDGWRRMGDPFMLQRELGDRSESEIGGLFGDEFAAQVMGTPIGDWQGPLRSTFGAHLVRVLSRTPAALPPFEEVAAQVRDDLLSTERAEASERAYQALRERYRVEVERD